MSFLSVSQLLKESLHGLTLKSFALLARVSFLIFIVPTLVQGELGIYIYISSTALIVATIGILGLNEELPRIVAGDISRAASYFTWFYILAVMLVVSLVVMVIYPGTLTGVVLLSLTLLTNRFLGGLIRSVDVAIHERQQNLPWVIFICIALILQIDTAFDLILIMSIAIIMVQWWSFISIRLVFHGDANDDIASLSNIVRQVLSNGAEKLISNLFVMGALRGPVLWPVWLGMGVNLDQLAFAVSLGEVVTQFGSIPVNRAYSRWCNFIPMHYKEWLNTLYGGMLLWVLLASVSVMAIFFAQYFDFLPKQAPDMGLFISAMIFYSLVPAFRLLRYLLWSRGILGIYVVIASFILFGISALIVFSLPVDYWFIASASLLLIVWLTLTAGSKKYYK